MFKLTKLRLFVITWALTTVSWEILQTWFHFAHTTIMLHIYLSHFTGKIWTCFARDCIINKSLYYLRKTLEIKLSAFSTTPKFHFPLMPLGQSMQQCHIDSILKISYSLEGFSFFFVINMYIYKVHTLPSFEDKRPIF